MGLLDGLLGTSIDDPRTMATAQAVQGLLSGGKALPAISNGLLAYGGSMQQSRQQKALEELRAAHLQQQQMQVEQAKRQQAFLTNLPTPAADPAQAQMLDAVRAGVMPFDAYLSATRKDNTPKYMTVAPGGSVFDERAGRPVYTAPKEASAPADWQLYQLSGAAGRGVPFESWIDARKKAGASSTSVSYGAPVAGVDAKGNPVFFQPSKDGSAPSIVQGVAPEKKEKPLTEAQAKAAAFASQMMSAEQALSAAGVDGSKLGDQVQTRIAQGAGNFVVTPEAQKSRQAQEQWAESYLRFKTGAAATEGEVVRNVRTFFPQPGDSAAVVAQKAQARQQAMHDVAIAAGGAKIETLKPQGQDKQIKRTGTFNGRKVVQYADGTTEYAD